MRHRVLETKQFTAFNSSELLIKLGNLGFKYDGKTRLEIDHFTASYDGTVSQVTDRYLTVIYSDVTDQANQHFAHLTTGDRLELKETAYRDFQSLLESGQIRVNSVIEGVKCDIKADKDKGFVCTYAKYKGWSEYESRS